MEKDFHRELDVVLQIWKDRLVQKAEEKAPTHTGKLKSGIHGYVDEIANSIIIENLVPYALYHDMGTGMYSTAPGAKKRFIRPKSGKALKIVLGNVRSKKDMPPVKRVRFQSRGLTKTGRQSRIGVAFIFRIKARGTPATKFISSLEKFHDEIEDDVLRVAEKFGFG